MIRSQDDLERALAALLALDPRLSPVAAVAGAVPLRLGLGGLAGLCATVVSQQVSKASAEAIFARLSAAMDLGDPSAILAAPDAAFRQAGLSAAKHRTILALAEAARGGAVDFSRISEVEPGEAIADLVALKGIGPWTAECFLLFSAGHPDIFPAGDLALRLAVAHGLGLDEARPKEKAVADIARAWSPHRSAAARLFWSYYHWMTRRDAAPAPAVESAAAP